MAGTFLTPLLPERERNARDGNRRDPLRRVLAADPALAGRVFSGERGTVILTGPAGGPPPTSLKERQRWELHVRLRIAAELGETAAGGVEVRWLGLGNAYD